MRVLLVDDHPLFRAGLEGLLRELEPDVQVVHAGSCAEGVKAARLRPLNMAFLDLNLPDANGLECLAAMKKARPSLPVVVVSGQTIERETLLRALELRAMGFVPKTENADMIVAALRAALAGGVFLPASVTDHAPSSVDNTDIAQYAAGRRPRGLPEPTRSTELGITPRQGDVLRYVVQGLPNKRIALNLGISVPVVKKHVSDLLAHFGAVSRTQLVAHVAQNRIYLGRPGISDPRDEIELVED